MRTSKRLARTVLATMLVSTTSLGIAVGPAAAAVITVVDSTADAVDADPTDGGCVTADDECTLRAAIQQANQTGGLHEIVLPQLGTGSASVYRLTIDGPGDDLGATGDLDIAADITITAQGDQTAIVQADFSTGDRVFDVQPGGSLTLNDIGVWGGRAPGQYGGGIRSAGDSVTVIDSHVRDNQAPNTGANGNGGGIGIVAGTLTVTGSLIENNTAGDDGGGISIGGSAGRLIIEDSVILANTAGDKGGGVEVNNAPVTNGVAGALITGSYIAENRADDGAGVSFRGGRSGTITDSTLANNIATSDGGAIEANTNAKLDVTNTTISGNRAAAGAAFEAEGGSQVALTNVTVFDNTASNGAITNEGSVTLRSTVVANNPGVPVCSATGTGTFISLGSNLDSNGSCGLTQATDLPGTDPKLQGLTDNGGSTPTHLPSTGSPVLDAGGDLDPNSCPGTDQRGVDRPQDGNGDGIAVCDIGAVEALLSELPPSTGGGSEPTQPDQDEVAPEVCQPAPVPPSGFEDVADDNQHRDDIDCLVFEGIAFGRNATSYDPSGSVSRGQLASFLARTMERAGVELPEPAHSFVDIDGNVHGERIAQLAVLGIVEGTTPSTFEPDAAVSRAQMASLVVRTHEAITGEQLPGQEGPFTDVHGTVHATAIDKAYAAGLTNGVTATTYAPADPVRRDQMAGFLVRLLRSVMGDASA